MSARKFNQSPLVRGVTVAVCAGGLLLAAGCSGSKESPAGDHVAGDNKQPKDFLSDKLQKKLEEKQRAIKFDYPEVGVAWEGNVVLYAKDDRSVDTGMIPASRQNQLDSYANQIEALPGDGTAMFSLGVEFRDVDSSQAGSDCYVVEESIISQTQQGVTLSPKICKSIWNLVIQSRAFNPATDLKLDGQAVA